MKCRLLLIFAAMSGFVFVALGAFGAHVLRHMLSMQQMEWLQTGLQYQAIHTLSLLAAAVLVKERVDSWFYWSSWCWILGIVLFSGSLYCLALSPLKIWVYITPIGGICFLLGWVLLLVGAIRMREKARVDG